MGNTPAATNFSPSFRLLCTQYRLFTWLHTSIMQNPDAKKEEFRKYLEKSGVIDSVTKGEKERENVVDRVTS